MVDLLSRRKLVCRVQEESDGSATTCRLSFSTERDQRVGKAEWDGFERAVTVDD